MLFEKPEYFEKKQDKFVKQKAFYGEGNRH
jgi:hypothetical protein